MKKHFSKFIAFLAILIIFSNCQNETSEIIESKAEISLRKISFDEISENSEVIKELGKLTPVDNENTIREKTDFIYDSNNDFIIDLDEAIYVEKGDYDSYTFKVLRTVKNDELENLVVSRRKNGSYKSYLISYDLTDAEKESISNKEVIDLKGKYSFKEINFDSNVIVNLKTDPVYTCPPGECCREVNTINEETGWPGVSLIIVPCDGGSGDGNDNEDGSPYDTDGGTDIGTGGGGSGSGGVNDGDETGLPGAGGGGGTGPSPSDNDDEEIFTSPIDGDDDEGTEAFDEFNANRVAALGLNLTPTQTDFLISNPYLIGDLENFLDEDDSSESENAAFMLIEAVRNNRLTGPYNSTYHNLINQYTEANLIDPATAAAWAANFSAKCAILKFNNPSWSNTRVYWEASKEMIHLALDIGGLVPVIGEVCDLVNGAIYTIEGDGVNATLSFAAAIPVAGWWATGAKYANKALTLANGSKTTLKWVVRANGLIDFGRSRQLRKVLGITDSSKHAHHLIPWAQRNSDLVQNAAKDPRAFHLNEALNGIPRPNNLHLTGHNLYNNKIQEILFNFNQANPNLSVEESYDFVKGLADHIRDLINANPTLNSGQIANLISYP